MWVKVCWGWQQVARRITQNWVSYHCCSRGTRKLFVQSAIGSSSLTHDSIMVDIATSCWEQRLLTGQERIQSGTKGHTTPEFLFKEPVNKELSESDMTELIIRNVLCLHSGLIRAGGVLSPLCVYRSAYACLFLEGALDAQGQLGITQLSVNFKTIKSGVGQRLPEPWETRLDMTGGGGRTVEQQQTVISAVGATPQCPIQSKESHLVG